MIECQIKDSVCVVAVEGDITRGTFDELKEDLRVPLKMENVKGLALDLSQVGFVDSSGVGLIFFLFKALREQEKNLVLFHVSTKNHETFRMTRVDNTVKILKTEPEALATFDKWNLPLQK